MDIHNDSGNLNSNTDKDCINVSKSKEEAKEVEGLIKPELNFSHHNIPSNNSQPISQADSAVREEAIVNTGADQPLGPQSAGDNRESTQSRPRRTRDFEGEFHQNSLQYLLQSLDNLREILQIVIMNTELATSINIDLQNRNRFNLGIAQTLNNTQLSILNSQNQIHDQLRDIRRIVDANSDSDQPNGLLNFLIPNNPNLPRNNENQSPLRIADRILPRVFGSNFSKNYNRIFLLIFICSILIILTGLSSFPNSLSEPWDSIINWIVSLTYSNTLLIGSGLLYTLVILKFNQLIYEKYTPYPHRQQNFFKELYVAFTQYTPLYDLSFLLMSNAEMTENRLVFFLVFCLLIWYLILTKVIWLFYQKFNRALASLNPSHPSELSFIKRIQYVMAIYILLNLQMSYGLLWLSGNADNSMFSVLLGMVIFTTIEPVKGFISASISIRNYSIVSDNNTRQLSDPKFKSELLLDATYNIVFLGIISLLIIDYPRFLIGYLVLYCSSGYNTLQNLAGYYKKYSEWKLLQQRIDEIFPIIEQNNKDHICSICHESLLIGRKLPCGHIFHLKCFVYWLENKKNCPNCRADLQNLRDIQSSSQSETRLIGWFNKIQEFMSNLFN